MSKLLIIDDEDVFRETITKRFSMRGYDTVSLNTGKNIEKVITKMKDIDVVILDLKMPDISGEEVLRRIKELKPEIQVIILTAHGSTESAVELTRMDAFSYLQKPVDIEKLIKIVDNAATKANLIMAEKKSVKTGKSYKQMLLFSSIAVIVGVVIALLPTPETMPERAHYFLAFLSTIIVLWTLEAIPIGITALLTAAGLVLFGIQSPADAWAPFANPAVMFVMMIIMFGVILNEVGIAKRILYFAIKAAGTNVVRFSLFIAILSSVSSAIFHDATITIIFLFAVIPIFMKMGITPDKSTNLSKFFCIMIPLTASAGGFGTILGGGRNPIAIEILHRVSGIHIGFLEWIIIQFPMVLVSSVATWAVCYIFMPPKVKELPSAIKTEKLPTMSKNEIGVAVIFGLAFVFWTLSDFTGLHVSVVAALALIAICSLKFVAFKTVIEKFAWEAWLVFGAGVSLGIAMLDTGAGKWLADLFIPMLEGSSDFVTYYGLGIFGSTISSFISNSAAVALCLPIMLPMADGLALNPAHMALMLPATTSFIMLVIGCPPSIISYSTGYFTQLDFIRVAVPKTIVLLAIMAVMMMIYWPIIGFR